MENYNLTELEDFELNHYIHHFDEQISYETYSSLDDIIFDEASVDYSDDLNDDAA